MGMATGLVHFRSLSADLRDHEPFLRCTAIPIKPESFQKLRIFQHKPKCTRKLRHAASPSCSQDPDSSSSKQPSDSATICECLVFIQVGISVPFSVGCFQPCSVVGVTGPLGLMYGND